VPRGSVTTTHHRLRPNQAQVLPPIKTKPKPILNRLTLKPTYSKRPPKQPKLQKHPAAHALSLSRTPQAHPPSPAPTQSVGPPSQGGSHRRCSLGGYGLLGHRNGGDPPTPASVGGYGLPGAWAGGGRGRA